MKKQYDTKRLTDELSRSVFFQEPERPVKDKSKQPALATRQQNAKAVKQQSNLTPKHQNTKVEKNQSTEEPSNQSAKDTKQESRKEPEDQSTKAGSNRTVKTPKLQDAKALKHFSSYLEPGTYKALRLLATEREKKDYEVLQEAVEQYLEREQANK